MSVKSQHLLSAYRPAGYSPHPGEELGHPSTASLSGHQWPSWGLGCTAQNGAGCLEVEQME